MAVAICHADINAGDTSRTCNNAVATHVAAIVNAAVTTTSVWFGDSPSLSPGGHMTGAYAPIVHIQAVCNHDATIKHEALGRASATNPSGQPNAVVHNRGYNESWWGEYRDKLWVMQEIVSVAEGMNNTLPPYLHDAAIPM